MTWGAPELPAPLTATATAPQGPDEWFVGPPEDPDRYELIGEGIAGGEGVTWRARYRGGLRSPLPVAVKVLHRHLHAGPEWPTPVDQERWRDQVALLRHVSLVHLVRVNEIFLGPPPHRGSAQEFGATTVIIEMEWVEGATLGTLVRGRAATRATVAERLGYVQDVCTALAQLHSHTRTSGNLAVHRDVTPANCMVNAERGVVLIDVSTLQMPGDGVDIAGFHTPSYSAPEVLAAPHLPRRAAADVYSVGALALFCLTGQDPPPLTSPRAVRDAQGQVRAATRRLGSPQLFATHLLTALSNDPDLRPADLLAWAHRLRELGARRTAPMRRRALGAVALLFVLLVAPGLAASDVSGGQLGGGASIERHLVDFSASAPTGTITSPRDGATVRDCAYFTGRTTLPRDTTLMLSNQNLTTGNPVHYVEFTFDFRHPVRSGTWQGAVFFNQSSAGQLQQVQLIAVNTRAAVKAWRSADYRVQDALAKSGTVLASTKVVRLNGPDGKSDCAPPR